MEAEIMRLTLFREPKGKVIGKAIVRCSGVILSGMAVIRGKYGPMVATRGCWSQGIQIFLSREVHKSIQKALRRAMEVHSDEKIDFEEYQPLEAAFPPPVKELTDEEEDRKEREQNYALYKRARFGP